MDQQSDFDEAVAPAANARAELQVLETAALNLIEPNRAPINARPPIHEEAVAGPPADAQPNNEPIHQVGNGLQANEINAVQVIVIPEQVVQVPVQAGRPNLPVPIDIFRDYPQTRRRRRPYSYPFNS